MKRAQVPDVGAAVWGGVGVEDFLVGCAFRGACAVVVADHWGAVDDGKQGFAGLGFAIEADD